MSTGCEGEERPRYYPEANVLVSVLSVDEKSNEQVSKSVQSTLTPSQ